MDVMTRHGYLVIADISGFTSYLATVELEHAHEILTHLLETIVKELKTLMTIAKLEGDAVFAYATETNIPGGERILELVENTYIAFRQQRETSQRNTTCTCKACQSIPMLDLKFFIHHGDFVVQEVSGIRELVGSDVNLIHRLMKNHITRTTGWRAYLLLTKQALDHLDIQPEGLLEELEKYEHLGEIRVFCLNLHERYETIMAARRVIVSPEEADLVFSIKLPAPAPVVWHYLTDLEKKSQVFSRNALFSAVSRPGGRTGPGASNHCAHGKNFQNSLIETILDWRPFEYFTVELVEGKVRMRETYHLDPLMDGQNTRLRVLTHAVSMRLPKWIKRPFLKLFVAPGLTSHYFVLEGLLAEEQSAEIAAPSSQPGS